MTGERWSRLRTVFDAARALPPDERPAFLDHELRDEPALRAEVDALLAADTGAGGFLAASPEAVGPYRILERVGEGGFGIVYRAEQEQPLRRIVALKLIKPGMDTREVIARFDTERQALAMMDHPGIARVFDAGQTDAGRPFFVMEFVDGIPVTNFADEAALSVRERIELFVEICDAVQHAHQKGVIHRDLKPSNVLVARRDGTPVAKVIDFGIAKATSGGVGVHTLATRRGAVLGTLGSMSPEQAGAIEAAVDTRTDIYALGVLLYELLAGAPPFDGKRLRSLSWTDAVRVIREEDPPQLTARYTSSATRNEIAARRGMDVRGLMRALQGDLEWITGRAHEKEPARRYPSVSEFAADLRRHLATEPVLAGPPSAAYRVRKFVRRNRVGVGAAAIAFCAILAGGVVAVVGFTRAVRAERAATRQAEVAERVSEFLVSLFESARPGSAPGEPPTAESLLNEGTRLIESRLQDDPEVRAKLMTTMGRSYLHLDRGDAGISVLEKALSVAESSPEKDPKLIAFQLIALANGILSTGSSRGVADLLDRAFALASATGNADAAWLASGLYDRANLFFLAGDSRLADSVIAKAIEFAESSTELHPGTRARIYELDGQIAYAKLDLDRAERSFHRSREFNALGASEAFMEVSSAYLLSSVHFNKLAGDSALHYAEEAVDIATRKFPPGHPMLGSAFAAKARALQLRGELPESATFFESAVGILRTSSRSRNLLANELESLSLLYFHMGRVDESIARGREAVDMSRAEYGEASLQTGKALSRLAIVLHQTARRSAAESCYVASIATLERVAPSGIVFANALMNYGTLCRDERRLSRADSLYRRAEAAFDSTVSGSREYFGMCLTNRGYLNSLQGSHNEADRLMQRGMAFRRGDRPETSPDLGPGYVGWAAARELAGDSAGAFEKLRLATACGATVEAAREYPELMALRPAAGFPLPDSK